MVESALGKLYHVSMWRGRQQFEAVMRKAGFSTRRKDLSELTEALRGVMRKAPSPDSIYTACMSGRGRGFKKDATIEAMCRVLKCKREDLYEDQEEARRPNSHWERITAGLDLEDIRARSRGNW